MEFPENREFLDREFGPAIEPQNGLKSWEHIDGTIEPILLTRNSAAWFIELVQAASSNPLARKAIEAVIILWVVDEGGDLYFAMEDVIDTQMSRLQRPRTRGISLNDAVKPLGHPLLIAGGRGRIGGEIYVDRDENDNSVLILNNRSGRYGRHPSRTPEHLENVTWLFRTFGVTLIPDFAE